MTFNDQVLIPQENKHVTLLGDNVSFRPIVDRSQKFGNAPKRKAEITTLQQARDEATGDSKRAEKIEKYGKQIIDGFTNAMKGINQIKGSVGSQIAGTSQGQTSISSIVPDWKRSINNTMNQNFKFNTDLKLDLGSQYKWTPSFGSNSSFKIG